MDDPPGCHAVVVLCILDCALIGSINANLPKISAMMTLMCLQIGNPTPFTACCQQRIGLQEKSFHKVQLEHTMCALQNQRVA